MPVHGSKPLPGSEQGVRTHDPQQGTIVPEDDHQGGPGSGTPPGIGRTVMPLPGTSAGKPDAGPGAVIEQGKK